MTYITGKMTMGISGQTVSTDQRKYDIDPDIKFLDEALNAGSFYFAIQGPRTKPKKKVSADSTFKCFEKEAYGDTGYLNGAILAADTAINIDDGAAGALYAIKPYDIIMLTNHASGAWELILVLTLDDNATPTQIATCTRNFGNQAAASDWDDNTQFVILENLSKEDSSNWNAAGTWQGDRLLKSVLAGALTNYTGTIKTPFGGTRRALKTILQTGKSWDELKKEAWILHTKQCSKMLLFSQAKAETTYGRTAPDGLISAIKGRGGITDHIGGNWSIPALMEFMEQLFAKDPGATKVALCSAIALSAFDYWKKGMLQMKSSEEFMGLKVGEFGTSHGNLILIRDQNLKGPWAGTMVAYDPNKVTYRYFQDDDTHVETNIQGNEDHGRIDEYLSDIGIQVDDAACHGLVTGIVGYI